MKSKLQRKHTAMNTLKKNIDRNILMDYNAGKHEGIHRFEVVTVDDSNGTLVLRYAHTVSFWNRDE